MFGMPVSEPTVACVALEDDGGGDKSAQQLLTLELSENM